MASRFEAKVRLEVLWALHLLTLHPLVLRAWDVGVMRRHFAGFGVCPAQNMRG